MFIMIIITYKLKQYNTFLHYYWIKQNRGIKEKPMCITQVNMKNSEIDITVMVWFDI